LFARTVFESDLKLQAKIQLSSSTNFIPAIIPDINYKVNPNQGTNFFFLQDSHETLFETIMKIKFFPDNRRTMTTRVSKSLEIVFSKGNSSFTHSK
jgi:hypothetical protein